MDIDFAAKRQQLLAELGAAERRRQEVSLAEMKGEKSPAEVKIAADAVRDIQERLADLGGAETLHDNQVRAAQQAERLEQRKRDAETVRTLIEVRRVAAADIDRIFLLLAESVETMRSADNNLGRIFLGWAEHETTRQQETAQGVSDALSPRDLFQWMLGALERAGVPTDRPTNAHFMDGMDFATYIAGRTDRLMNWGKRLIPELEE